MLTLSLQQRSSCLPAEDSTTPAASMNTSVSIRPPTLSTVSPPHQLHHPYPTCPQGSSSKPKLAVDTSLSRVYGRKGGTSSLRLDTLSAASPTLRNTFQNGQARSPSPSSKTAPLLATPSLRKPHPRTTLKLSIEPTDPATIVAPPRLDSGLSSASSSTSSSSTDSEPFIPYSQPPFLRPILSNTRRPREGRPFSFASSKPMFPTPKRVCFQTPMVEEIVTVRFTMRHSDISRSPSPEVADDNTLAPPAPTTTTTTLSPLATSPAKRKRGGMPRLTTATISSEVHTTPTSPTTGDKRESSSEEESDEDSCPNTPVAGRKKRQTVWAWTLGPLPGVAAADHDPDGDIGPPAPPPLPLAVEGDDRTSTTPIAAVA